MVIRGKKNFEVRSPGEYTTPLPRKGRNRGYRFRALFTDTQSAPELLERYVTGFAHSKAGAKHRKTQKSATIRGQRRPSMNTIERYHLIRRQSIAGITSPRMLGNICESHNSSVLLTRGSHGLRPHRETWADSAQNYELLCCHIFSRD
jgi:hypothetical protein